MTAVGSAIVVGGGIAGLVAARALALRGVAVTLLERKPAIEDEAGIGIGIQNNAMNALGEVGLAQGVVAAGVPVEMIHLHAPDGSKVGHRPTDRLAGSPWPGFTGISRAALHGILVAGASEAGVTLITDALVEKVGEAGGSAEAFCRDGRRFTADLLVACDGISSRIRDQLFPESAMPQPTGEAVWRGLVPGVQLDDVSFVFGGPVGTIGYCPLRGEVYLYIVDTDDRAPPTGAPDMAERMAALVAGVEAPPALLARKLSRASGDVTYRRLETVQLAPPWYRGRIVLIGDAAHAGPPTLAQGAAMGIEDGVVLAQSLAGSATVEAALPAFMARRWDRVNTIVAASLTISRAQMEPDGQARVAEANRAAAAVLAQPY